MNPSGDTMSTTVDGDCSAASVSVPDSASSSTLSVAVSAPANRIRSPALELRLRTHAATVHVEPSSTPSPEEPSVSSLVAESSSSDAPTNALVVASEPPLGSAPSKAAPADPELLSPVSKPNRMVYPVGTLTVQIDPAVVVVVVVVWVVVVVVVVAAMVVVVVVVAATVVVVDNVVGGAVVVVVEAVVTVKFVSQRGAILMLSTCSAERLRSYTNTSSIHSENSAPPDPALPTDTSAVLTA